MNSNPRVSFSNVFQSIPRYLSILIPNHPLGVGCQFLAVAVGIIGMALMGMFNVHRHGSMNSAAIFLYALASTIAGYVSSSYYRMMGGTKWIANVNLTTILFAGVLFCH